MLRTLINVIVHGEQGHAGPSPGMLAGVVGAVLLGIGAANDTGWLAIAGGIVLAVGIAASQLMHHMMVEYGVFKRLDDLEGKGK
jgi:hypothetical protein